MNPITIDNIGVAHNVAIHQPKGFLGWALETANNWLVDTRFSFIDDIKSKLDFCGLNYYGKEILGIDGPMIVEGEEYSESGRNVHPDGIFDLLMMFHKRYENDIKSYIVTENGISDGDDILRPAYIYEHL